MSTYEVNPDDLFTSDDSQPNSPSTAAQPSPPKRPRLNQPSSASYPPSALSGTNNPSSTTTSSFPSFKVSNFRQPSLTAPSAPPARWNQNSRAPPGRGRYPNSQPFSNYQRPNPGPRPINPPPPQFRRAGAPAGHGRGSSSSTFSALGPAGRGRSATLPAHVTGFRGSSAPPVSSAPVESEVKSRVEEAASILPDGLREKFIQEEKRKEAAEIKQVPVERKRPSRKRRVETKEDIARREAKLSNIYGGKPRSTFGLNSLLAATNPKSLINLDSGASAPGKAVRRDVNSIYKKVSMTKDAMEREERKRKEVERKREEEKRAIQEHYRELRHREKIKRDRLINEWKMEKTVSAGMRDNQLMARVERHLYHQPKDREKMDTLEYLGLNLKQLPDNDHVTNLLTVEVFQL